MELKTKMMERFMRWLGGEKICICCEKTYHTFSFGYGKILCPTCYTVDTYEKRFIELDKSYWLNRLMIKLCK